MTAVLVNYDLIAPGQKYTKLIERMKGYPGHVRLGGSSWILSGSSITATSVQTDLLEVLDANDTLFTVDITGRPYGGNLTQDQWDWLTSDAR